MRYIWLVYLGALFFQPAFDPTAGPLDWFAAIALIAVFLPLYVAGHRAADDRQTAVDRRRRWPRSRWPAR